MSLRAQQTKAFLRAQGDWVRTSRQKLGLTLDQLADKSGLARSTVWNLEHGSMVSRLDTFIRLCGGLSIAPGEALKSMIQGAQK